MKTTKISKWMKIQLQLFAEGDNPSPDANNKKTSNYLEFATEEDFKKHTSSIFAEYEEKIHQLQEENKTLKLKDVELEKANKKISIFTDHLKQKYDVQKVELDNQKLDYSNYDNLEKSIIKQLENKQINYKKSDSDLKKDNPTPDNKPKIFL